MYSIIPNSIVPNMIFGSKGLGKTVEQGRVGICDAIYSVGN